MIWGMFDESIGEKPHINLMTRSSYKHEKVFTKNAGMICRAIVNQVLGLYLQKARHFFTFISD